MAAPESRLAWGGVVDGFGDFETTREAASPAPLASQPRGADMLYSSGTTGRPKGIKPDLPGVQVDEEKDLMSRVFGVVYGFGPDTVYLSPAPLYHAAPLRYCAMTNALGGTVIMMDRFDAEGALRLIDEYSVTHSQWVPTMFVRMLKLPDDVRNAYDVSSLKVAVHAAAPCPAEIKRRMIEWWGPVISEYYAATEGVGITVINSEEALAHPGSVGRAVLGVVHICDDAGVDLPVGEVGTIYFERDEPTFVYHNDPAKTKAAQHPDHEWWTTTGDLGYLDAEGYLYLTDRKAFTIISGGVNIYPQESENVIINHPAVYDVGVIGLPDDDLGERPVGFVQLMEGVAPSESLAQELIEFTRNDLAAFKAPKEIRFIDELPRTPTGKLVKRTLRDQVLGRS
ncbi:acyl-coenzyme A synthetase/AMP-(fatty) acid ligase [Gordonia hydrophobica]|nr:acyl-coenzyme A synthetase/AMP-(fatty) acid ligase [Gordonia hydrophobica]